MKKYIARLLFYPVTWLFIEILEELRDEVKPKSYVDKLIHGKWIITGNDNSYDVARKYL